MRISRPFMVIVGIAICMFIMKVIIIFSLKITPHAVEDWYIASNVSQGHGYSLQNGPTALKTPIYPLFLIPFSFVHETGKQWAAIMQHLLWLIATLALWKALLLRFGKNFAFVGAIIFCVHPAYLYYPTVLESTSLTVPLMIIFWWMAEQSLHSNSSIIPPLLVGWLAGLCQPLLIPCVIFLQLFFFGTVEIKRVLIIIITACIVFGPWTLRNAWTFGKFIPTKSPMWMNVYEGMNSTLNPLEIQKVEQARKIMNDIQMEEIYKPIVLKELRENPWTFVQQAFHRFVQFWTVPDRYGHAVFSIEILLTRIIPQCFLGIGMIASGFIMWKHNDATLTQSTRFLLIPLFTILYVSIVYSLTQAANIRFKLDIEWLQILLLFPLFHRVVNLKLVPGTRQ